MTSGPEIDLQTAAAELGVHYQTAYRWVRSGRLPAVLVDGKYLVDPSDLARCSDERTRPTPPAPPSDARVERQAAAVLTGLFEGEETVVRTSCERLVADGLDPIDLVERVISPALVELGRAWHAGEIDIWVEHRASAIVERTLGDIAPNPRGRRRGVAAVAAITGDRHALATTMATLALRSANWRVHHLGADTPPSAIHSFLTEHPVDLVVLSNTTSATADATAATAEEIRSRGFRVLVGRPGARLRDLVDQAAGENAATSAT